MTVEHPAYDLLPAIHRIRDAEQEFQLRKLLEVVEEELAQLRADVDGLYDDWFIETCAEWVVPYIGALLAVPPLQPVPEIGGGRSLVANTIGYRRRTGTAAVLELVARDVTGWAALAVEYFALLVTTQHLDHVRIERARTADLRDADGLAAIGTPFDEVARNADVRHIDRGRGRYNLPDIGLHLWRLDAYPVTAGDARDVDKALGQWTFDPAGRNRRLFRRPAAATPDDGVGADDVPAPLTRRALLRALLAAAQAAAAARGEDPDSVPIPPPPIALPGPDPILAVRILDDSGWKPARLIGADLSNWARPGAAEGGPVVAAAEGGPVEAAGAGDPVVAVDPVLGRITVPVGDQPRRIAVDYAYGFPGDIGAGPHDRRAALAAIDDAAAADWAITASTAPTPGPTSGATLRIDWSVTVSADPAVDPVPGQRVRSIGAALALWDNRPDLQEGQVGVIAITDSATYVESLDIVVPAGDRLLIVAATVPPPDGGPAVPNIAALAAVGVMPHVVGDIRVRVTGESEASAEVMLDGLSVEGDVHVAGDGLTGLVVADCTLLDDGRRAGGWIRAENNRHLAVRVLRTVAAGAVLGDAETLAVADSILHAGCRTDVVAVDADSARADVTACTIFGETCVRVLTASNTIFRDRVEVRRLQEGCVRFSYLPFTSRTPRRYLCQPASEDSRVEPVFTADEPVDPAFAQLAPTCPREIARGADDEGEMGAYHYLQQPQRLANLTAQLDRYLRFGLEAGLFFAT